MKRLFLVAALAGCGIAVPKEKQEYVGTWLSVPGGPSRRLDIAADGKIHYQKSAISGENIEISFEDGQLRKLEDGKLVFGTPLETDEITVTRAPYREGDRWKMRIFGVDMEREK